MELKDKPARTPVCHQCLFSWCRASGFIALGRRTLFFFFLSLFLSTLFLLAYFHAIKFSHQHYSDPQTSDEFIVFFVELVTDDQTSGTEYPRPPPSGYLTQ